MHKNNNKSNYGFPACLAVTVAILLTSWPGCGGCADDNGTIDATDIMGDDAVSYDVIFDEGGLPDVTPDIIDTIIDFVADGDEDNGVIDVIADDTTTGCTAAVAAESNFTTVQEFMDYIDEQRRNYGGEGPYMRHDRYKGIPWEGEYHTNTTFPNVFAWDEGLAARAQEEACRLAEGGTASGVRVNGQSPEQKPFWIYGINTADWMISVKEDPGDWENISEWSSDKRFGLHHSNGSSRLGLHYHDFGGDGPAINRVGAGAADSGGGSTWWVLQFGP